MLRTVLVHLRSQWAGFLALFLVIAGGTAYAANTVFSGDIVNGEVKAVDIADNAVNKDKIPAGAVQTGEIGNGMVRSIDVFDNGLTGTDVDETTLNGGGDLSGPLANLQIGSGAVGAAETGTVPAVRAEFPADRDPSGGCLFTLGSQKGNLTATGTPEALPFESETFDTAAMHIDGSNCENPNRARLTMPRSGIYLISAGVLWEQSATGTRYLGINRFDSGGGGPIPLAGDERPANDGAGAGSTDQSVSTVALLNQGDFLTAEVNQTSGGNLHAPLVAADSRNYFSAIWLAPAQ